VRCRETSIQNPESRIQHQGSSIRSHTSSTYPMSITITKIEHQKKNKQRYSLYSEDKFILGISIESLLEFNISAGMDIPDELLHKIEQKEKYVAIREQAWRFLARRMHSRKELRDKLIAKKHEQIDIDKIIHELENKKYLNDTSFAQQIISDEINLNKTGPLLIKNKLLKKGVDINII
jgi:regulatory protein